MSIILKMSLAFSPIAQQASAAVPELPTSLLMSVKAYGACLDKEILSLEPSGADLQELLEAAKFNCADDWLRAYNEFIKYGEAQGPSPSGKSYQQIAIQFLDETSEKHRDQMRPKVLKIRADRNSNAPNN